MKNKHVSSLSRKRDRQALEQRRFKAVKLHKKGFSQYRIAKDLSVSFEAVSNWIEIYEQKGLKGLKTQGQPGPKSPLTNNDRRKLKAAILKGPEAFGYDTGIWTLQRIAALIRKLTKTTFKTTQTWRIVTALGFSCQKPDTRAKERDEEKIQNWKLRTFPRLKKMGAETSVFIGLS
jgi:transposase